MRSGSWTSIRLVAAPGGRHGGMVVLPFFPRTRPGPFEGLRLSLRFCRSCVVGFPPRHGAWATHVWGWKMKAVAKWIQSLDANTQVLLGLSMATVGLSVLAFERQLADFIATLLF